MLSWICRSPMLRLRRVARAVAFRSSAASLCRELRRAFPSTNPISMLEQGERPNAALVGVGLVLGLAMALVVRHQQHGAGRQPRNARLFAAWGAAAVTIAKGRLWLWRYLPFCLRPWAFRLLGTRYSPAIKVNRVFALRHSNYSEKLRWTLELSGEQFQEVPVAVFLARPTALYHSLGASERLPIVSTSEGRGGLQTVPALTEHLSKARWRAWMYPEGAHELENKFEQDFGDAAMGVAYAYLFRKEMHSETMEILSRGLPLWQRMLVPTLAPGVMLTMSDGLRLKEALSANMRIVEKTFGFVESILSDGRCYLCGDSISMADITFASLAFPVILPEETASVFVEYDPRFLPRGYVETIKSLRSREGGMFALRLYRHKRTRKGGAAKASCARSPRRGRSFTVRKNVNSPSRTTARGRGDRRATITQATRTEPLVPPTSPKHRASIVA